MKNVYLSAKIDRLISKVFKVPYGGWITFVQIKEWKISSIRSYIFPIQDDFYLVIFYEQSIVDIMSIEPNWAFVISCKIILIIPTTQKLCLLWF